MELAAGRQVVLLTGGPGTGKTTCLRGVLALFERMGLETALAAPTGPRFGQSACPTHPAATALPGSSPKSAGQYTAPTHTEPIGEIFRQQMGARRLLEFLGEHHLPMELAALLRRAYGDAALP